jgi:transcriptional regulator
MYLPDTFRVADRQTLLGHAEANPFATVITTGSRGLLVSHLPLLVDAARNVLRGHLARENPQAGDLEAGAEALAIFHGPHGYVSPSVYVDASAGTGVPTWNYVAVHAHGHARLVDTSVLRTILDASVARFDATGWRLEDAARTESELQAKMAAIAGFEIDIERLEGKWKLSQNRSAEDRGRVIEWLEKGDTASRAVAAIMRERA